METDTYRLRWLGRALPCCLPLLAYWPSPAGAVDAYQGEAREPGASGVLYRESHWIDDHRHVVLYTCPDGKPFARKRLDTSPGDTSPDFEMDDGRDGYRQGVRSRAGKREVFVRPSSGAAEKTAVLTSNSVIDAGFDRFLHAHWDQLVAGEVVRMEFLVPSRLKAMHFVVRQVEADAGMRTFRLELGNLFGGLLPKIDVDYDARSRRLLAYRGLTDVRDGHGEQIVADVRFPPEMRGTGERSLAAALQAPLSGRCTQ